MSNIGSSEGSNIGSSVVSDIGSNIRSSIERKHPLFIAGNQGVKSRETSE